MKFENTTFFKRLDYKKVTEEFGVFYLADNYLVAELNEGIHFDWK